MNDFRILLVVPVAVAWMLSAGCDKKLDDAPAVAAKDYLVQVGIPSQQISVISYGKDGSSEDRLVRSACFWFMALNVLKWRCDQRRAT